MYVKIYADAPQAFQTCRGTHPHQPLEARRAESAANYQVKLLKAILDGMTDTQDAQQHGRQLSEDDWDATLTMSIHQPQPSQPQHPTDIPTSSIPRTGGGTVNINYRPCNAKNAIP